MGKGTFPGKFAESADTATFRSFPNQLQGISEPVDLGLQPPDIPHRLWAAHPLPPSQLTQLVELRLAAEAKIPL